MKKRFGANSFDMKILKRKCNQKCRDTNRNYFKMQSGSHKVGTPAELLPHGDEEEKDEKKRRARSK